MVLLNGFIYGRSQGIGERTRRVGIPSGNHLQLTVYCQTGKTLPAQLLENHDYYYIFTLLLWNFKNMLKGTQISAHFKGKVLMPIPHVKR